MQAEEFADLISPDSDPAARKAAAQRWKETRPDFVSNVQKIARGKLGGVEPVGRIRSALHRRASESPSRGWIDKVWGWLPS